MKQWDFSLSLLLGYLAIFHLWLGAEYQFVLVSGVLWSLTFVTWFALMTRRGYFANRMDGAAHGVVIADVLLEAILLREHDHWGFWLCALAFAVVIGGYRWKLLRAGA